MAANFFSGNPTCSMHPHKRSECGWFGISKATCEYRGCCFDSSFPSVKWCFPKEITVGMGLLLGVRF